MDEMLEPEIENVPEDKSVLEDPNLPPLVLDSLT
jgi:hypothetical protein